MAPAPLSASRRRGPGPLGAALILCLLLAGLAGCGLFEQSPPGPALPEPQAPSLAPIATPVCLRIIYVPEHRLMEQVVQRLETGDDIAQAAAWAKQQDPMGTRDQVTCDLTQKLDPHLAKLAQDLPLGQRAGPFKHQGGWALVMATTSAYLKEGRRLADAGRQVEAKGYLVRDLALNPDDVPAWHLLAMCRASLREWPQALAAYDQGLQWAPKDPNLWNDKGGVLLHLDRGPEALAAYRQAHELAPGNPVIQNNLAWAMHRGGVDPPRAEELARSAVKAQPDNGQFLDTLGQILSGRGKHAEAMANLDQAASLGVSSPGGRQARLKSMAQLSHEDLARLTPPQAKTKVKAKAPAQGKPARPASAQAQAMKAAPGRPGGMVYPDRLLPGPARGQERSSRLAGGGPGLPFAQPKPGGPGPLAPGAAGPLCQPKRGPQGGRPTEGPGQAQGTPGDQAQVARRRLTSQRYGAPCLLPHPSWLSTPP